MTMKPLLGTRPQAVGRGKQRLAIARTLPKNPPLLVFDDATLALDSANERAIKSELMTTLRNKTPLVIAHRLSTIVEAHEILVLTPAASWSEASQSVDCARRSLCTDVGAVKGHQFLIAFRST
jgi:ATP-binding cassette, subfamily B, heavy metal transporter